jgi:hypothetical protein
VGLRTPFSPADELRDRTSGVYSAIFLETSCALLACIEEKYNYPFPDSIKGSLQDRFCFCILAADTLMRPSYLEVGCLSLSLGQ